VSRIIYLVLFALVGCSSCALANDAPNWTESIVSIQSSRVRYNFYQPWYSTVRRSVKNGVVVDGQRIITTADWMQNSTLVRVQRAGRGKWWKARIESIDYHANLAVLKIGDAAFWDGLTAVPIHKEVINEGEVRILRRSQGKLERWGSTIRRVAVRGAQRSFARYMMFEATSDIDSSGWSEVVTRDRQLVGLVASQGKNDRLLVIPAPLIRALLTVQAKDSGKGLGYFDFRAQSTKNPANAAYLGLPGQSRGVIVTGVPPTSVFADTLQPRDIILEIDGFEIDQEGEYKDPDYGYLAYDNLATRGKFSGDEVTLKIWRDGNEHLVKGTLPKARYEDEIVPDHVFDRRPQYLVAGGLVFQPLTADYLRSWGKEWWKGAPFRLRHYLHQPPTAERRHVVILSRVLPDPVNVGYQNLAYLVVDEINGQRIVALADVRTALESPLKGFHVVQFMPNSGVQKVVLDAGLLAPADDRIIRKYGIANRQYVLE